MEEKPTRDSGDLDAIAGEVKAGHGPVAPPVPRPSPLRPSLRRGMATAGRAESAESTAWWRRDAAERRNATGEESGDDEDEQGLDEDEFRRRFAHLFRCTGAATEPGVAGRIRGEYL